MQSKQIIRVTVQEEGYPEKSIYLVRPYRKDYRFLLEGGTDLPFLSASEWQPWYRRILQRMKRLLERRDEE